MRPIWRTPRVRWVADAHRFLYLRDGGEAHRDRPYTVEITRALRDLDEGLEIVLINPYPDSEIEWYQEFEGYPVPSLKRVPMAASFGNWVLHRAARDLDLDVLHDPCGIAPFLYPARRYARVTTIHDAVPLVMPEVQPLATRLIFRTLIPATRFSADAVITISHASARDLVRHAGVPEQKLFPIHYGMSVPPQLSAARFAFRSTGWRSPPVFPVRGGHQIHARTFAGSSRLSPRFGTPHPEVKLVGCWSEVLGRG